MSRPSAATLEPRTHSRPSRVVRPTFSRRSSSLAVLRLCIDTPHWHHLVFRAEREHAAARLCRIVDVVDVVPTVTQVARALDRWQRVHPSARAACEAALAMLAARQPSHSRQDVELVARPWTLVVEVRGALAAHGPATEWAAARLLATWTARHWTSFPRP